MNIFFISIDTISRARILRRVEECVRTKKSLRISTVNPEFFIEARKNIAFASALQSADIRVRDGFGTGLLFWFRGHRAPRRITGADLVEDILKMADKQRWTVFIANRKDGLSTFKEIRGAILTKYPGVKIEGEDMDIVKLQMKNEKLKMGEGNPTSFSCNLSPVTGNLIFCSFGAPYQEIFLQNLQQQNIPAIMMGVGGSFDFLTRKQKRAPKWMQESGLEWLFRLIINPHRIRRIFRAVVIFPFLLVLALYSKER